MSWHRLDADKTKSLLDTVRSSGEAILFSEKNNEAKCMRLPFYNDLLLYRIVNTASLPIFSMDFLGADDGFFYLDGSDTPLSRVSQAGKLQLREDNIAAYVQFYFYNVVQEDGEIYPLFMDAPLPDLMNQNIHASQIDLPDGAPVFTAQQDDDGFSITTPLYFGGSMMIGAIRVALDGAVTITNIRPMLGENLGGTINDAWT